MILSLRGKKIIVNQVLLNICGTNICHICSQIYTKIFQKRKLKKEYTMSGKIGKIQPPRHLVQVSILKDGLGILDIDTQLNTHDHGHSKNKMDSKVIKFH